jgi:hypothetical protein
VTSSDPRQVKQSQSAAIFIVFCGMFSIRIQSIAMLTTASKSTLFPSIGLLILSSKDGLSVG